MEHQTPPRILIVEDDADIRETIATVLACEGYEIAKAENGLAALREARARLPDVILLDLMMPAMNGWQFRAVQREDPRLAGTPVITVSACLPQELHGLDAVAHLHKPFDLEELLGEVERVVGPGRGPDASPALSA